MTYLFNSTQEIVFVLHGLTLTQTNKYIYFAFILILYLFTIFLNLTLIITIFLDRMLHNPMYFFLCNLCINCIFGASAFYPKILHDIFFYSHVISYVGCMTQIFFIFLYIYCEFTTLTVMAYDRYVAICRPLQYHCVLTIKKLWSLIILTWLFPWLECSILIALTASLPLCGVVIDKIYCANWEVVKLSCIDTTLNNIYGFILLFCQLSQTICILISYVNIVNALLHSQAERSKFMQTCLPHLITLANFGISILFDHMYARYGRDTSLLPLRNIMGLEFLVVPPLLNPIIYGMNLNQVRNRVRHMLNFNKIALS